MARSPQLMIGSRLRFDGRLWAVEAHEPPAVRLRSDDGGQALVAVAALLADPDFAPVGDQPGGTSDAVATTALLDSIPAGARRKAEELEAHVRELTTGFRSGHPTTTGQDEPRHEYATERPLRDKLNAKAAETGRSSRQLERDLKAYREHGLWGLVDQRGTAGKSTVERLDERVSAAMEGVIAELINQSNVTLVQARRLVTARLYEEHGDAIACPPQSTFNRAFKELSRGRGLRLSGKTRRSIANRPETPYRRHRPTRPGEMVVFDTYNLDAHAVDPLTFEWCKLQLTVAQDLYSASLVGWRFAPETKAVDAAMVLYDIMRPAWMRPGWPDAARWRYHGVPEGIVVCGDALGGARDGHGLGVAGKPVLHPETVTIDHGKVFLSRAFQDACERLGISVQLARPLTPTDKARVERTFRTIRQSFVEALPGYKGPDVWSRGADAEGEAFYFLHEIEALFAEWVVTYWQRRHHDGLHLDVPNVERLHLSPNDLYDEGLVRAGFVRVPASPTLYFDLLPTEWRTVQHYGVELIGLRYDGPALNDHRNRTSAYRGEHAGKWPIRYDPRDRSVVYFQDPDSLEWSALGWVDASIPDRPFDDLTLGYAKAQVRARGGNPSNRDELRTELKAFLDRVDADVLHGRDELRVARQAFQRLRQVREDRGGALPGDHLLPDASLPAPDEPADLFDPDELAAVRAAPVRSGAPDARMLDRFGLVEEDDEDDEAEDGG